MYIDECVFDNILWIVLIHLFANIFNKFGIFKIMYKFSCKLL